jgi:hypothetical protein
MRRLLICFFALAGCGSVDVTPDPPRASGHPCVTSLGCPVGERCDEGKCAADVGCPGPSAPRVLYENANDISYPAILSVNDREYLLRMDWGGTAPGANLQFIDLATGTTSVLHQAPGYATCGGDPLWCTVTTTAGTTSALTDVTLDASTQVWSAAASHDFPVGYPIIVGIAPDGELILTGAGKPDLQTFNRATGQSTSLFDLGGRTAMRIVALPSGPIVTAYTFSGQDGSTASFAPLVPGAGWTTILTSPEVVKNYWLAVPAGSAWFLVGDFLPSGIPQVWGVSPTGTHKAGPSDDPMIPEIANRYSRGEPLLDGTRGKGLACKGDTCQSAQLDLATLERSPIGSITLPGVTRSSAEQQRWLACDAVDAIVYEPIFPAGDPAANAVGYRLHAVRVLPDITL